VKMGNCRYGKECTNNGDDKVMNVQLTHESFAPVNTHALAQPLKVVAKNYSANGGDHPARAVDSTQVKTADRGLGVHRLVIPSFEVVIPRYPGLAEGAFGNQRHCRQYTQNCGLHIQVCCRQFLRPPALDPFRLGMKESNRDLQFYPL